MKQLRGRAASKWAELTLFPPLNIFFAPCSGETVTLIFVDEKQLRSPFYELVILHIFKKANKTWSSYFGKTIIMNYLNIIGILWPMSYLFWVKPLFLLDWLMCNQSGLILSDHILSFFHDNLSLIWSFKSSNSAPIFTVIEFIHLDAGFLFSSTFAGIKAFFKELEITLTKSIMTD